MHFTNSHRLVSMNVELPERAGPNLALGTLLTWNQTTLADYGQKSRAPTNSGDEPKLPDKIADRLKKKITVDYRRTPLQDAIASIAEDTGVKIKLDGPGMKLAGVTQNETQTFQMEDVPASDVLVQDPHREYQKQTGSDRRRREKIRHGDERRRRPGQEAHAVSIATGQVSSDLTKSRIGLDRTRAPHGPVSLRLSALFVAAEGA